MRTGSGGRLLVVVVVWGVVTSACQPIKYTLAGADSTLRETLQRGLLEMKRENYQVALEALNKALWDLEQIEKPGLRLPELAEAHQALADVYSALRRVEWADEQRTLAKALADLSGQDAGSGSPEQALARGKAAYVAARFREALTDLRRALIDLEGLTHTPARVRSLEEARCFLAFTYVAIDLLDRAKEEIRRLWALDPTLTFCQREAPPAIRRLIDDARRTLAP